MLLMIHSAFKCFKKYRASLAVLSTEPPFLFLPELQLFRKPSSLQSKKKQPKDTSLFVLYTIPLYTY